MESSKYLKNGCMGCLLTFGAIFLLSMIITFYYAYTSGDSLSSFTDINKENTQPFEVMTKKGVVTLHLGMPKDSIVMIVGKPDNIQSHSDYNNDIIEELEYKIKSNYSDLRFTFKNGKLKEFRQD